MVWVEINLSTRSSLKHRYHPPWMSTMQSMTRSTTWNPSNRVCLDLRPYTKSPSLSWRRIWIVYHKSEEDQPPSIEGLPSSLTTQASSMTHHPYQTGTRAWGCLQLCRAGLGIRRARSPPSYPTWAHLSALLSHPVLERKPNASHMCARIKFHTYDRQYKCISEIMS
jgi:hypothetical protein